MYGTGAIPHGMWVLRSYISVLKILSREISSTGANNYPTGWIFPLSKSLLDANVVLGRTHSCLTRTFLSTAGSKLSLHIEPELHQYSRPSVQFTLLDGPNYNSSKKTFFKNAPNNQMYL